jgi:putative DNA primase/helicase
VTQLTDFNDLHVRDGLNAVATQLLDGLERAALENAEYVPGTNLHTDDDNQAPPNIDLPPLDEQDIPLAPFEDQVPLTLETALQRFALAMPDGKVWDAHRQQLLKKAVARDYIGRKLFDEWSAHAERRTVDQYAVRRQAATAQTAGGGGLSKALARYVYLYPSNDAWDGDKRQRVPLSSLKHAIADCFDQWIKSESRMEIDVERLVFDPTQRAGANCINTFRGLPLKPRRDDAKCAAIVELIVHLCNGDEAMVRWLLCWLAYPLQHVGAKMATGILMHSQTQGTGKSLLFEEVIKPLYGEYGSTLGQHQLESQYTDWRSQLLFGLFEEIFSRDQKYSHTGTLKHMITGKTQRIEKKFMSGWEESNYMNAVFLSNEMQPFPLEQTDRRLLVIWPRSTMRAGLEQEVVAQVRSGGIEAFYALLLAYPLDDFHPHTKPILNEEKERLIDFGRPAWEVFVSEWRDDAIDVPVMPCLSDQLFAVYRRWCERRREHVVSQTKFAGFLAVQDGISRRRDLHYLHGQSSRKGTFFIPKELREPFKPREGESQTAWLGRCVNQFEEFATPTQPTT